MDNSISIKDIINLILGKIWIVIIALAVGGAVAFGFSKCILPLKYSSHISMYVQSYTGIYEDPQNYQNNISNSKQLINTYIEVLKDDAVMRAVGEKLEESFDEKILNECFTLGDEGITPASLRSCISITTVTDTSALTVTTTTKNAEVAAAICNFIADVAQDYIHDAVGVGSISTIDTAKVYSNPVSPNTKKNIMLGAFAGMILSILVIIAIDFFDNTVKDTNVLASKYNKSVIGEVQKFGQEDRKHRSRKNYEEEHIKLTDENVPFSIIESYKSIRMNVKFAISTFDKKIVVVSSANPGEGKSTLASNISIATAQSGSKVLLIDADMRKPVQHKIFGIRNKNGLSSAISKMNSSEECICKNVMENLDIMPAGPVPPNPSELLSSDTAKHLLEKLSETYDLIIIDTPPVCVVSDALTLSECVAGLIMVVRERKTTYDDVEEANNRIELANMNMLGYILNDVDLKHNGIGYSKKYGYSYKYKYGYVYGKNTKQDDMKKVKK